MNPLKVLSPLYGIISGAMGSGKQPQKKSSSTSAPPSTAMPSSYKRGGKVRRGGMAKVHKGEKIIKGKGRRRGGSKR